MRMKWREQLLAKTVLAGVASLGVPGMLAAGTVVFTPTAVAQSSVGQVYGDAPAGARVVLKDLGTGATTSTAANAQGRYAFNQVAPGRYSVTANEFTREVSVVGGLGIDVKVATGIVGAYGGGVYLATILGAWLADRLFGSERVLFYAAVMVMFGHVALAVLPAYVGLTVGLILIAIGAGGVGAGRSQRHRG